MKQVSGTEQTIIAIEIVLEPVEVQVPLIAVPVEVRNIAVAVRILPNQCTRYLLYHCSLNTLGAVSDSGRQSPLISRTK